MYRLITRHTYEAVMFERASMKLGLEQAVLCQARDKGPSTVRVNVVCHSDRIDCVCIFGWVIHMSVRSTALTAWHRFFFWYLQSEIEKLIRRGAYGTLQNEDQANEAAR